MQRRRPGSQTCGAGGDGDLFFKERYASLVAEGQLKFSVKKATKLRLTQRMRRAY